MATGRIAGAFIPTDIVLEESLEHLGATPLGAARSDLIVASCDDDGSSHGRYTGLRRTREPGGRLTRRGRDSPRTVWFFGPSG
ncbi:MAG TPA: hypothetical protein VMK13_00255 [Streptosporangiaceae bacterium]|nr:hypothetical protein [Streptosporangiaceae bacterium]